jgi:hypothetical protein
LKPAERRPQALRDQQGEVRHDRKEGGSRVAEKVAKAATAALDPVELGDPLDGARLLGERRNTAAMLDDEFAAT